MGLAKGKMHKPKKTKKTKLLNQYNLKSGNWQDVERLKNLIKIKLKKVGLK